jgi:hypothetical protein
VRMMRPVFSIWCPPNQVTVMLRGLEQSRSPLTDR